MAFTRLLLEKDRNISPQHAAISQHFGLGKIYIISQVNV